MPNPWEMDWGSAKHPESAAMPWEMDWSGSVGAKSQEPLGDTNKGFQRSFAQVPELAYGTAALAAMSAEKIFGEGGLSTAAKDYFAGKYAEKQQANQQYAPTVEFTDAWDDLKDDPGKMVDWIQDSAGYVVGQGLQTVLTGGIGALAGKMTLGTVVAGSAAKAADKMVAAEIAKRGLEGMAAKQLADQMLPVALKTASERLTTALGAGIVLTGQNLGMEAGDIYGGLTEEAKKTGEEITGADLVRAWSSAGAAAATETLTDMLGLGALTGRIKIGGKAMQEMTGLGGRVTRGATAAAVGMPLEGGQEYIQTGLEQFGAGQPMDTPEAAKERINAAAVGTLGGAVMGGGIGAVQGAQPAEQPSVKPRGLISSAITPSLDESIQSITEQPDVASATGEMKRQLDEALTSLDANGIDAAASADQQLTAELDAAFAQDDQEAIVAADQQLSGDIPAWKQKLAALRQPEQATPAQDAIAREIAQPVPASQAQEQIQQQPQAVPGLSERQPIGVIENGEETREEANARQNAAQNAAQVGVLNQAGAQVPAVPLPLFLSFSKKGTPVITGNADDVRAAEQTIRDALPGVAIRQQKDHDGGYSLVVESKKTTPEEIQSILDTINQGGIPNATSQIRSDEGQVRQGGQEGQPSIQRGANQGGQDLQFNSWKGRTTAEQQAGGTDRLKHGQAQEVANGTPQATPAPIVDSAQKLDSAQNQPALVPDDAVAAKDQTARTDKIGSQGEQPGLDQYLAEEPGDRKSLNTTIQARQSDGTELSGTVATHVENAIANGYRVALSKHGPALVDSNMQGWDETHIGKAGMRYANWLSSRAKFKLSNPNPEPRNANPVAEINLGENIPPNETGTVNATAPERIITRLKSGKLEASGFTREEIIDAGKVLKRPAKDKIKGLTEDQILEASKVFKHGVGVTVGNDGRMLVSANGKNESGYPLSSTQEKALREVLLGKNVRTSGSVTHDRGTLRGALMALGGINNELKSDAGGDKGSYGGLFSANGKITDFSEAASALAKEGFSEIRNVSQETGKKESEVLEDMIGRMLKGEKIYTDDRATEELNKEEEKRYRQQIYQAADEFGVKRVGKPFSQIEDAVHKMQAKKVQSEEDQLAAEEDVIYDKVLAVAYQELGDDTVQNELEKLATQYADANTRVYQAAAVKHFEGLINAAKLAQGTPKAAEGKAGVPDQPGRETPSAGRGSEAQGFDLSPETPEDIRAREEKLKAAHALEVAQAAAARREERAKQNKADKERRAAAVVAEREAKRKAEVAKLQNPEDFVFGKNAPAAPPPIVKKVSVKEGIGQGSIFDQPAPKQSAITAIKASTLDAAAKLKAIEAVNNGALDPEDVQDVVGEKPTPEQPTGDTDATLSRFRPRQMTIFTKPYVGKTGAKLVGYEWKWTPEAIVDNRGEDRVIRVSDWEEAITNPETNRDIVHQFQIEKTDGEVVLVSAESAAKLLGVSQSTARSSAKRLLEEEIRRQKEEERAAKEADRFDALDAQPTPSMAIANNVGTYFASVFERAQNEGRLWGGENDRYKQKLMAEDKYRFMVRDGKYAFSPGPMDSSETEKRGWRKVYLRADQIWDENGNDRMALKDVVGEEKSKVVREGGKPDAIEQEYDDSRVAFKSASRKFTAIREDYRAKKIGDAEYFAGKAEFDKASKLADAAETKYIEAKNAKPVAEKPAEGKGITNSSVSQSRLENLDPLPEEATKVQDAVEGGSAADAARFIIENAPDADYRLIGEKVLSKILDLEAVGVKFNFHVAHAADQVDHRLVGVRGFSSTLFDSNETDVWVQGADMTGLVGTSYETVLHELVHAVTQSALHLSLQDHPSTELGKATLRLYKVAQEILNHGESRLALYRTGDVSLTDFEEMLHGIRGRNNAVHSVGEIIAWGFTNRQFQNYIEAIPYSADQNMWTRFVQAIREFLGLSAKNDTALSEVLDIGEKILNEPVHQLLQRAVTQGINLAYNTPNGMIYNSSRQTQEGKGNVLEARDTPALTNETPETIRAALSKAFGKSTIDRLEQNGMLAIYADAADLPSYIHISPTGMAAWDGDKAHLIANRMVASNSKQIILHEIGEHAGLERMLGSEGYAALKKRVAMMNKLGNKRVQEAYATVGKLYPEYSQDSNEFMHEILANIGQDANIQSKAWWKEVIAAVKRFLVKMGYTGLIKDSDIQDMVLHSLKMAAKESREAAGLLIPDGYALEQKVGQPAYKDGFLSATAENGHKFETGLSVTFEYLHNTESATKLFGKPNKESEFDRGYEASGRYVIAVKDAPYVTDRHQVGSLTLDNPLVVDRDYGEGWKRELSAAYGGLTGKRLSRAIIESGHDGVVTTDKYGTSEILDLTTFDYGKALYSRDTGNILEARLSDAIARSIPQPAKDKASTLIDKRDYDYVDRFTDLRKIQKLAGPVPESQDASLAEEGYTGKVRARTDDFHDDMLKPLVKAIHDENLKYDEVEEYLHARHAPSRNAAMKEINPTAKELDAKRADLTSTRDDLADSEAVQEYISKRRELRQAEADIEDGIADESLAEVVKADIAKLQKDKDVRDYSNAVDQLKALKNAKPYEGDNTALSGMSNKKAGEVIAKAKQDGKEPALEKIAGMVDAITAGTRKIIVESGLEKPEVIKAWEKKYEHYVPLHVDEVQTGMPAIGQGFNIRGKESKRATGSQEERTNILAHVMAQHEAAIVRSEKVHVDRALFEFAQAHPDSNLWELDKADMVSDVDKTSGLVVRRVDPMYKQKPNVLTFKIDGEEHTITFNEKSPEAMRMAAAFKNLSSTDLGEVTILVGRFTRLLATMNTSANPVFVARNFMRDLQTAFVNLSDTELADVKGQVFKNVPNAIRGFWNMSRGDSKSEWGKYAREFRDAGGQVGWMDHYKDIGARAMNLKDMLSAMEPGKWNFTKREAMKWWNLIEDANMAVENGVRLSAYVAARKMGMSEAKAAALAKNLTVNFNRHGAKGVELNMWYMFMNASIQGTARLFKAMGNKNVQKILGYVVASGFLMSLLARSLAGDDDDDGENDYDQLPEYVKDRNFVFWVGGRPVTIPMPYGYNFFATFGRKIEETMFRKNYSPARGAVDLASSFVDAFSPTGQSGSFLQFVFPTIADPFIQWSENKSFSGAPLRREQIPFGPPKPEYQMGFKSTSAPAKWLSELLNDYSGGNEARPGLANVNPTVFDFAISSITGGGGRTYLQLVNLPIKAVSGEEIQSKEVPGWNIFMSARPENQIERKFFENLREVQTVAEEFKAYRDDPEMIQKLNKDRGAERRLIGQAKITSAMLENIRKRERALEKTKPDGWREAVKQQEKRKRDLEARFNKRYIEATQ